VAFQASQLRIKELELQVKSLSRRKTKKVKDGVAKHDDEVKTHAKKFTLLYELFIPSDDSFFSQPRPIGVDVWSPDRYRDEASRTRAILAELYIVFPDHLHTFISGHSQFNTNVSRELVTTLTTHHSLIIDIYYCSSVCIPRTCAVNL
jgi:hypothetical protein